MPGVNNDEEVQKIIVEILSGQRPIIIGDLNPSTETEPRGEDHKEKIPMQAFSVGSPNPEDAIGTLFMPQDMVESLRMIESLHRKPTWKSPTIFLGLGILVALLVLGLCSKAHALTPRVQVGEAWGVNIQDGEVNASSPATLVGFGASTAINDQWNVTSDLVVAVSRTKFYPGFRPVVGLVHKFQGWSLASTVMYQYNPPYSSHIVESHTVGPTIGFSFPLAASGTSFSLGLGYRAQFIGDKTVHVLSCGPTFTSNF